MDSETFTPMPFRRELPLGGPELQKAIEHAGKPTMRVEGGWLCIPLPNAHDPISSYDIELKRINTPKKLLAWVVHLANKPWMGGSRLKEFVRLVASYHKMDLPHSL